MSGYSSFGGNTRSWCSLAGRHSWIWGHERSPPLCSSQTRLAAWSAWSSTYAGRSGSGSSADAKRDKRVSYKGLSAIDPYFSRYAEGEIWFLSVLLLCTSIFLTDGFIWTLWLSESSAAVKCGFFIFKHTLFHFNSFSVTETSFNIHTCPLLSLGLSSLSSSRSSGCKSTKKEKANVSFYPPCIILNCLSFTPSLSVSLYPPTLSKVKSWEDEKG